MNPRFKQQLLRYWLAANAAALQGAAVTTKTFLGLAGANAAGVPVPVLTLQQAGYVFLISAAYHLIDFLAKNPLPQPPNLDQIAAVTPRPISLSPATSPSPGSSPAGSTEK